MLDVLLCYGFAATMIRAGYVGLVADLFRQVWAACRDLGATYFRLPSEIMFRRRSRLETHVTSMT